jgi:3-oxoadipate CoA-transferase alpha subunit
MIDKVIASAAAALRGTPDGATAMIGGFGTAGPPDVLLDAWTKQGPRDLAAVSNNAGNGETGLAALLAARRERKIICSVPRRADSFQA